MVGCQEFDATALVIRSDQIQDLWGGKRGFSCKFLCRPLSDGISLSFSTHHRGFLINGGYVLVVVLTYFIAMVNFTIAGFHCRSFSVSSRNGAGSMGYWKYFDGDDQCRGMCGVVTQSFASTVSSPICVAHPLSLQIIHHTRSISLMHRSSLAVLYPSWASSWDGRSGRRW
jgi:hypothetical protein